MTKVYTSAILGHSKTPNKGGEQMSNIAISLKSARVNANLTQKQAAEKIGVSESSIINWERDWEQGKKRLSVDSLQALANLYNMSIDVFLS